MTNSRSWSVVPLVFAIFVSTADGAETEVSIRNGQWRINGQVTYPGARAEGLLLNVRMVNAIFEDRGRPGFDLYNHPIPRSMKET